MCRGHRCPCLRFPIGRNGQGCPRRRTLHAQSAEEICWCASGQHWFASYLLLVVRPPADLSLTPFPAEIRGKLQIIGGPSFCLLDYCPQLGCRYERRATVGIEMDFQSGAGARRLP